MTTDELVVSQDGAVLTVTFNRPEQRNAMTFAMYEGLEEACARADADDSVRVLVLRGAGGRAFVAGTDIAQFQSFTSGNDGITYEERIERVVNRLEDVTVPTVAAIEGACVGGGLAIAAACHLRIATSRATLRIDRQLPSVRAIGTPNFAPGVAMRKSHTVAMASPPPIAQPSSTATVGMGSDSTRPTQASMRCS